jgi:hypothetical protein
MNYKLKTQAIASIGTSDIIYIYRILNNFSAKEIGSLRNSFKHTGSNKNL